MDFSKLDNQNKIPAKNSVKLSTEKVNKKAVWGLDYTYNNGKTWVKATGRKPVTDSRITSSASVVPPKPKAPEDDLDIPSFLRKKI